METKQVHLKDYSEKTPKKKHRQQKAGAAKAFSPPQGQPLDPLPTTSADNASATGLHDSIISQQTRKLEQLLKDVRQLYCADPSDQPTSKRTKLLINSLPPGQGF